MARSLPPALPPDYFSTENVEISDAKHQHAVGLIASSLSQAAVCTAQLPAETVAILRKCADTVFQGHRGKNGDAPQRRSKVHNKELYELRLDGNPANPCAIQVRDKDAVWCVAVSTQASFV
jgi:hypothetical protein